MSFFKNSVAKFTFLILILTTQSVFAYVPLAEVKYNQGLDYSEKSNYSMAIQSFEEAVKIDPAFSDAYFNLGVLYEYSGKSDKAIAIFEQLLKNHPTDSEAAFKIASLCYKLGQYSKAMSYVTLITVVSPKYKESQTLAQKITAKINLENQKAATPKPIVVQPASKALEPQVEGVIKDFISPTGITKDIAGNLYVANYGDNSITKVSPDGKKSLIARGKPLNGPIGIAIDKSNNIYIANYASNEVLKINPAGKASIVVKNIQKPYYLYFDNANTLYISEQGTNTIVKLKL
jgi:tetratricopeptide (TPR) repeat protein